MEVTTFHPIRPPLMWSSDASMRAAWKGVKNVVDTVLTSPTCRVARAIADSAVNGSRNHHEPLAGSPTEWPSAKNTASRQPRSAVRASSSQ